MSDKPMTEEQLRKIEERRAQATPGPYSIEGGGGVDMKTGRRGYYWVWIGGRRGLIAPGTWEDAQFHACSWEDIGVLTAEVRRLQGEVDRLRYAKSSSQPGDW